VVDLAGREGPKFIWLGGGTSDPEPKVTEKVGMPMSLEGKLNFSSSSATDAESSFSRRSWAWTMLDE
jgi:hypothetical protein